MQLSSRILTALAVLILAVAVVAVRAGSPGYPRSSYRGY